MIRKALLLLLILFLTSCTNNPVRKSSLKLDSIFKKATELGKVVGTENIYNDKGEITSTEVTYDSSDAKQYIQSKKSAITKNYNTIKAYTVNNNQDYYDAVFVLAFTNLFLEVNFVDQFEDRCVYIDKIPLHEKVVLSEWVVDDLIGYYHYGKEMKKDWMKLSYDQKYEYVFSLINSPSQKGRKCIEGLNELEKRTAVFPPG